MKTRDIVEERKFEKKCACSMLVQSTNLTSYWNQEQFLFKMKKKKTFRHIFRNKMSEKKVLSLIDLFTICMYYILYINILFFYTQFNSINFHNNALNE
jgi:hypothetical protein